MLIVACQVCGETKVIAGTPDADGMARAMWICPVCGTGQVLQLPVAADARKADLRSIVCGMSLTRVEAEECR
ncbi:MAG: hypothetical protein BWY99_01388 [Synergistetes bacterium ADurb.BinA166]|jgi:transcription elongation factor Elf1|nr:MAG: hypothetical protein BWY99_01388 [Synergistetes bacterium ADurb.BinA166]